MATAQPTVRHVMQPTTIRHATAATGSVAVAATTVRHPTATAIRPATNVVGHRPAVAAVSHASTTSQGARTGMLCPLCVQEFS